MRHMSTITKLLPVTSPSWLRRGFVLSGLVMLCLISGAGGSWAVETQALVRSMFLPGAGQAYKEQHVRAAVFAGLAVASAAGIVASQVHYNQSVDIYNASKRNYLGLLEEQEGGAVISWEDLDNYYTTMMEGWDAAEDRLVWRNFFLVTFITVYAVNIIDVIVSPSQRLEEPPPITLDLRPGGVLIAGTLRF